MENNIKTQGFYLVDVDAVALNNAGKNVLSNFDNGVQTKTITKNGRQYVYASGQAVRFWWRNVLQHSFGWTLSPVIREDKVAYTNANPLQYPDDDVFGYMRAASEEITDEKGKKKKQNITVTRISPLKNSVLVSVASTRPVENWSSMARQEGDSVPYGKQEYSAVMKGMFSLDLCSVGTFSNYNKTGFQNLSEALLKEAKQIKGAEEIDDPFIPNQKLIRLPYETCIKRAIDTVSALKYLSGGAMQTSNMGDVTPKFIILATTNTGNHPFSHVVSGKGNYDELIEFKIDALEEVINDYKETFVGKIFVGRRTGFFDDLDEGFKALKEKNSGLIEYGPVNSIIDQYCEQLKEQMK